MTDLASTDVTITLVEAGRSIKRRMNQVTIAFGNGTLTYPSGGVPMPAISNFGMVRNLTGLLFFDDDNAQGIVWKYDAANATIRGYIQGIVVSAAGAATMDDFALNTTSEPLATAVSVSLTNSTGAGTKILGRLQELVATSSAPAATTLKALAFGW